MNDLGITLRRKIIALRVFFFVLAVASGTLTVCLLTSGCGVPAWLSDAGNIIALVGASFTSITSFVAGLTGNAALAAALAVVSTWITKVQTGISDLEALIAQYQQSASTGLLAEIEAALADLQANVQQDFSNLGLPATVLSVIAGIAGLAANLLAEWSAAIAGVKSAATAEEHKAAYNRITALAKALPIAMTQYKADVNKVLNTPTCDAMVDAALAKATRV
jgi:hypothetical protein